MASRCPRWASGAPRWRPRGRRGPGGRVDGPGETHGSSGRACRAPRGATIVLGAFRVRRGRPRGGRGG
eukprot:1113246-Pyramimonas_sp.AAC.1